MNSKPSIQNNSKCFDNSNSSKKITKSVVQLVCETPTKTKDVKIGNCTRLNLQDDSCTQTLTKNQFHTVQRSVHKCFESFKIMCKSLDNLNIIRSLPGFIRLRRSKSNSCLYDRQTRINHHLESMKRHSHSSFSQTYQSFQDRTNLESFPCTPYNSEFSDRKFTFNWVREMNYFVKRSLILSIKHLFQGLLKPL